MTKSRHILRPRKYWTDADLRVLRAEYANTPTEQLAAKLDRPMRSVYGMAGKLGLKKSPEYTAEKNRKEAELLRRVGVKHRFKKGSVPANKGVRRPGWSPGRMHETQFKKGMRQGVAAKLYKPIGTERISKDGYLERKINDDLPMQRRWRFVHLIVWEAAHGPVPPGHAVAFKPGRKSSIAEEITLDALELITRRELMKRNSVHNLPEELAQVVQLRGALVRQINKRANREKQD